MGIGGSEDTALTIAEELFDIIPDDDSDVTNDVCAKMLEKANKLDAIKDRL